MLNKINTEKRFVDNSMRSALNQLQVLDAAVEVAFENERLQDEARAKERALKSSTFKIGDVVRGAAGYKKRDQALLIVDVISYSECTAEDAVECGDCVAGDKYTDYKVMDKEGRLWNLTHIESRHPDHEHKTDWVTLIKRGKR